MKIIYSENNVTVNVTLKEFGSKLISQSNEINSFCRKYNAQDNIYEKVSPLKTNKAGEITGYQQGRKEGSVTFHSHSCDIIKASNEFIELLNSFGYLKIDKFRKVLRTQTKSGNPIKQMEWVIEPF